MQFDPILFDWESSALSLNLFRCTAQGLVEIFMKSLATFAADTEMKDRVFIANPQHHSWTSIQAEEGHFFSCQTELFASRMSTGAHSASLTSLSSWYYIHSNHVFATSHNKHIYNIFTQVAWKPVPFLTIWQICETRIRAGCTGRCNILYTCSVISAGGWWTDDNVPLARDGSGTHLMLRNWSGWGVLRAQGGEYHI